MDGKKGEAMSMILKGIDLPKRGEVLTIDINYDGTVWVDTKEGDYWGKHTDSAIQIPTPRGRLIPLEDVFRAFPELEPYRQGLTGLTILEAEE